MPEANLETAFGSYKLLVESVKDFALLMTDVSGLVMSWNKGAQMLTGYSQTEIIGRHISIFYTKEDVAAGKPGFNLTTAKESGHAENEGWHIKSDGSTFWASVVITALKDENGSLIGFGKVIRDMTMKKQAEEEIKRLNKSLEFRLQKSETEILDYKHALDEAAIVAITNQKGTILHVNENFCKISKYSKEELLGQDHRIIKSGYHPKEFIRNLWMTISSGRVWSGELKNKAKDGTFYWVDTTIVPFLNDEGNPYQYLAIRSDITQRKIAETQLYDINRELENKIRERTFELTEALERERELSEMKSRFVSLASHEFRTPLSAVLTSAALLDHYTTPDLEEKRRKHIDRIKSSVKNLTDILDDFLSLDKLEQGKVQTKMEDFNLRELIEDIIDEMSGMLRKEQHVVNVVYEGDTTVNQDKKILRNILLNLLSNATKYSADEKIIQLEAKIEDQQVTISVKDQGIGIPLQAQKELFEKFFRAGNVGNIEGTGLGLNIVKRYVELLGGTIDFTSQEDQGSIFSVCLPRY